MRELVGDVLSVDWDQFRLRRAASGLVSMLVLIGFLDALGDPVFAALFATLFTTAAGGDGPMSQRLPGMVGFTLIGAAIGGLSWWSTDSALAVAAVLGVATYLGTLAAAGGPASAKAGLYLTIWPLFALMMGSSDTEPWTVTVGFLIGGAVAIGMTALRLRVAQEDHTGDADLREELDSIPGRSWGEKLRGLVSAPIGVFALIRTVAVMSAVVLGDALFASYPLWVAITVVVVVRPSADQSLSVAVQRTLGTAAGVAIATVISSILPNTDIGIAIAFLVAGVLMVAFNNANYTLFATFLTAMLVFGQRLVEGDALEAGWQRLLATVVGAIISLTVMSIARRVGSRNGASSNPTSAR